MTATVQVVVHESQFPNRFERELKACLRARRLDPKFHYCSHKQTQAWLALHQAYSPAVSDPDCVRIYDECFQFVAQRTTDCPIHVVSLGCGGGQKEARLLRQLGGAGQTITLTLTDASPGLVITAQQAIAAARLAASIHPIVLDLGTAEPLAETILASAPAAAQRILTCFGLLPNAEPATIFARLVELTRPGDLVLLSANLAPAADYARQVQRLLPQYDNALTRDWLRLLLLDCGFERNDGTIRFAVEPAPDRPELLRITARFHLDRDRNIPFGQDTISFRAGEVIDLFYSQRYPAELLGKVAAEAGLKMIRHRITSRGDEGVFIGERVR